MKTIKTIKMDDINLEKIDYLNSKIYSDELKEKINEYLDSKSCEPLYIGIIGGWGSGKTTIVNNALNDIKNARVFRYDAWKYEDDSFRRTFIKSILDQSGINSHTEEYRKVAESLYEDYSISSNSILERIELSRKKDKNYKSAAAYIIAIIVIVIVLVSGFIVMEKYDSVLGFLLTTLSSIGFFNLLYAQTTYSKTKLFSPEQFYHVFKRILEKTSGKSNIIFIDNLDRCDGENLCNTLKSIKGFYVEKCKKKIKEKIVFIVPLDYESLNKAYKTDDSNYYIDKIFDETIYINKITTTDKMDFINSLVSKHSDIDSILTYEARDILASSYISTPREIIKVINRYIIEYEILCKKNGCDFFKDGLNTGYLMKIVIINRKCPKFVNLAYSNLDKFIENQNFPNNDNEEFSKKYSEEVYDLLSMTSHIKPTNYYEFFYNQNDKHHILSKEEENAIQTNNMEYIINNISTERLLMYYKESIYFDIKNRLWEVHIYNKFNVLMNLTKQDYFSEQGLEDLVKVWDKYIFSSEQFYKTVMYKHENIDELIGFYIKAKPKYKYIEKLLSGITDSYFSNIKKDKTELYSLLYGKDVIEELNDNEIDNLNNYIDEIVNNNKLGENNYLDVLKTKLFQYITDNRIVSIIMNITEKDISTMVNIIDSMIRYKYEDNEEIIKAIIYYINTELVKIKDMEKIEFVYNFILNTKNIEGYIADINASFSFDEKENPTFIKNVIDSYINANCINDALYNFISSFNLTENKVAVLDTLNQHIDSNNTDVMNLYIKYIKNQDNEIILNNISKIIYAYNKNHGDNKIILILKEKGVLNETYKAIKDKESKSVFINEAKKLITTIEEKIDNIFIYESDLKTYKGFVQESYDIDILKNIMEHTEKKGCIKICINRIVEVIDNKDIIETEELESIKGIIKSKKIFKEQQKSIIESLKNKINNDELIELEELILKQ